MNRLLTLLFCGAAVASAQSISFGVLGGAPFTNVINNTNGSGVAFSPTSSNFVVGPAFQLNLPLSLRFEVDALYRPYSFSETSLGTPGMVSASAQQWQFPFLLQYRFKTPVLKPFVEAGVSFDHLADLSSAARTLSVSQSNASVVLGGGVDVKIPFIRLSGELRYIHQGSANFQGLSNLNQAEVLVGVHF